MYYDIFGHSEYFKNDDSKTPIRSFEFIFPEEYQQPHYFNTLQNKLSFLKLTTSDFVEKFNEFASNPALLTDPYKHTSFLDTIVHFQFAMILVGMAHADLIVQRKLNQTIIQKQSSLSAELNEQKIDLAIFHEKLYGNTLIEHYNRGLYETIILGVDLKTFPFSTPYAQELQKEYLTYPPNETKENLLKQLLVLQELKAKYKDIYATLKTKAIEILKKKQHTFLNADAWKSDPTQYQSSIKLATEKTQKLNKEIDRVTKHLASIKLIFSAPAFKETQIPSLIEAVNILNTFDVVTSGQYLFPKILFGSPKKTSSGNTTSHDSFIDFMFEVFNSAINAKTKKLKPQDIVTLHDEQIFLTTKIETKLLSLQNEQVERKKFPKACPQILFAYILNLMLFTLLVKHPTRASLLGLDTKTWNAQLRLICHYLPVYFDNTQQGTENFDTVKSLKSYFVFYWADDYFDDKTIDPFSSSAPHATSSPKANRASYADYDTSDDDWSDYGDL